MGEGASIVTDIPKYFIYRDGVKVDEVTDVSSYWKEDSVAFLIGCSFSFEEALMKASIEVRHIAQGCNAVSYTHLFVTGVTGTVLLQPRELPVYWGFPVTLCSTLVFVLVPVLESIWKKRAC